MTSQPLDSRPVARRAAKEFSDGVGKVGAATRLWSRRKITETQAAQDQTLGVLAAKEENQMLWKGAGVRCI